MTRVVVTEQAVADLDDLIVSRGLPANTRARVRRSIRQLASFPRIGRAVGGRWDGARFIVGPWPWLIVVYEFDEQHDVVAVHAFHDGRSATAARPN